MVWRHTGNRYNSGALPRECAPTDPAREWLDALEPCMGLSAVRETAINNVGHVHFWSS
jgi:hypothetical protein